MKKHNTKKLVLLTDTVRSLDPANLGRVAGGKTTFVTCTCAATTACTTSLC
jgi:hypothetical protein